MKYLHKRLIMLSSLMVLWVQLVSADTEAGVLQTAPEESEAIEVVFVTTIGSFTLALDAVKAPLTVANFLVYVDSGFYDNTIFHRVIPGFVVQGGGFEAGMTLKETLPPVDNESHNGLRNVRGSVAMARKPDPNSATSQFFINLKTNTNLDFKGNQVGYTVFGKVIEGMVVLDSLANVPTVTKGPYRDVPEQDILILSASRKSSPGTTGSESQSDDGGEPFIAGRDYTMLDTPVRTRGRNRIEVVEMFSYGCPHCYEFEPFILQWSSRQDPDVDFTQLPAIWNAPMKLLARAFYTEDELNVRERIHEALFKAIVIDQVKIENESDLAEFFGRYGVDANTFATAFHSKQVTRKVEQAEARVKVYNPVGVPEVIVNGKYRVDRMRAGGLPQMLAVLDYLVKKERAVSGQ